MILLSGHSLTQARRVPVVSLGLSLKERDSTANLVPADMTGIGTESWLRDDTEPGAGIVWRVRSIQQDYATDTPTVTMEHAICTLRDRVLFGEVKASTITGNASATSCTAEQAVRYILRQQGDWELGSFGYSVSNPYKFDGETLYDALEKVTSSLNDAWWSYDFSRYPFRLSITPKPAGVACELRPGRNLVAIAKTIDRNGMYTRFYPIGKDDLHISGDYVSRNEGLYGVASKVEVDTTLETEAELRAWANERLSKHAEPSVNITADGLELADATGESLDRLTLGRICRIPLEEFSTTIEERIVELNYRDKANEPEVVRITLANSQEDVTKIIAENIKRAGGGGRAAARQEKEDHAWFEDTETHVAMCAEGIVGQTPDGQPDWARLSKIIVDGTGIHQSVELLKAEDVVQNTKINQNENAIILEANRAKAQENSLQSRIVVQANKISVVVEEKNGQNVVKAASIVAGINSQTGSYVKIAANTINLSGYVTVSDLNATNAAIDNLKTGVTKATKLSAADILADSLSSGSISATSTLNYQGHRIYFYTTDIGGNTTHVMGYR